MSRLIAVSLVSISSFMVGCASESPEPDPSVIALGNFFRKLSDEVTQTASQPNVSDEQRCRWLAVQLYERLANCDWKTAKLGLLQGHPLCFLRTDVNPVTECPQFVMDHAVVCRQYVRTGPNQEIRSKELSFRYVFDIRADKTAGEVIDRIRVEFTPYENRPIVDVMNAETPATLIGKSLRERPIERDSECYPTITRLMFQCTVPSDQSQFPKTQSGVLTIGYRAYIDFSKSDRYDLLLTRSKEEVDDLDDLTIQDDFSRDLQITCGSRGYGRKK